MPFNVNFGKGHLLTPPPSAYPSIRGSDAGSFYSQYPTSEAHTTPTWENLPREYGGPKRRPSQQSLRTPKAYDPLYANMSPRDRLTSLDSSYNPPVSYNTPVQPAVDLNTLQALYAGLLASQSQQLANPIPSFAHATPQPVQQPIIPPQIANNLDGLIAAATAYQQLLAAALSAATPLPAAHPTMSPTPVDVPRPPMESTRTDSALQSVLASYTMSAPNSVSSSPSSLTGPTLALSPPPHYRQFRKEQGSQRRGSDATHTHQQPSMPIEAPPSFHSSNEPPALAVKRRPSVDQENGALRTKPVGPRLAAPLPSFNANLSMEDRIQRARSGLLSSKLSFSSSMTPSPAPSQLSFLEHDSSTGYNASSSNINAYAAHSHSESTSSGPSVGSTTSFLQKTLSALSLSGTSDVDAEITQRPSSPQSDKEERELAKLERSLVELSFLRESPQVVKTKPLVALPSSSSRADERHTSVPRAHPQQTPRHRILRKPSTEASDEYRRRMRMALPPVPPSPPVVMTSQPSPMSNHTFEDNDPSELIYNQDMPRRSESPTLTELDFPMPPSHDGVQFKTAGMYKAATSQRRPSAPPPILTFTGEPRKRESIQRSTGNPRSPHHKLAVGRYV